MYVADKCNLRNETQIEFVWNVQKQQVEWYKELYLFDCYSIPALLEHRSSL